MSRYTGSVNRRSRRLQFSLLENNKEFSKGKKRRTIPGQHGDKRQRKSASEYKTQITEKQKIAYMYGLSDRQLRRFVLLARKMPGSNALNLLLLLESRLDNLVYRMGFAPTRRAARQLVSHGHVLVNDQKVDVPSFIVRVGAKIAICQASLNLPIVNVSNNQIPDFVNVHKEQKNGTYTRYPQREELNQELKETFVVEYYNRII
jgi:small subunit ribosomal protein S4